MTEELKEIILWVQKKALAASAQCGSLEARANALARDAPDKASGLRSLYCHATGEREAYNTILAALVKGEWKEND